MARLYDLSRRDKFYNQGNSYLLHPCFRMEVAPGTTLKLDNSLKFQSAAFSSNLLTPAIASVMYFFIPHRLVWDEWPDFVAQDDGAPAAVPSTATAMNAIFDNNGSSYSVLARRAYKLMYNEFFGDEDMTAGAVNTWYSNIETDTDITLRDVKNSEQWAARLVKSGELESPTYTVSGGLIDLNEFHLQMRDARSKRKAQMTGDKYVDALRRCGVEPDWRIQNAPEFLGRFDKDVLPIKTFNTQATGQGDSVARFEGTIDFQSSRKRFAEHGTVLGVFCLRPAVFNTQFQMPDTAALDPEDFFLGDNLGDQENNVTPIAVGGTGSLYSQRLARYRNGVHKAGTGVTWAADFSAAVPEEAVYVAAEGLPVSDELGGTGLAFCHLSHTRGATPVPPNSL